jgi:hypothetical protein
MLATYFPHDDKTCTDRIFKYLPNEVRGPIIAAWGIRGIKAALRDPDDKITSVVHDALVAGDVDHSAFEEGLSPEMLVRWLPLADLWAFWRGGKLTKQAIHKALSTAYELYLFDARWFLETITAKNGALKGTDVLSDGLTKDELTQWIRKIHEGADGSPKGLVAALGWDKIVTKTPNDVLVAVLDAMVAKVGLVMGVPPARESAPRLPDASAKVGEKADATAAAPPAAPPPPAVTAPAASPDVTQATGAIPGAETPGPLRETDKPPVNEYSWLPPPGAPEGDAAASADDGINVVLDEEAMIGGPPTAPRIVAAAPARPHDEEDTEVKQVPRVRSERPPARGPTSRR